MIGIATRSDVACQRIIGRVQRRAADRGLSLRQRHSEAGIVFLLFGVHSDEASDRIILEHGSIVAWVGHAVIPGAPLYPHGSVCWRNLSYEDVSALGQIDGAFSVSLYDTATRTLSLLSDSCGMYPLHYRTVDNAFLFGTSVDLLLHAEEEDVSLNSAAIAEYWSFGHCLGDKTFTNEIDRVPVGSLVQVKLPFYEVTHKRLNSYHPQPAAGSSQPSAQDIVDVLHRSVRRRISSHYESLCLLSGGWDSRALCGLLAKDSSFTTATTNPDVGNLDDPECARLVADKLGVSNLYIPLPPDYVERYWREKCILTDFATTMHTWLMPLTEDHPFGHAVNFDGIAGDVLIKGLGVDKRHIDLLEHQDLEGLTELVLDQFALGKNRFAPLIAEKRAEWSQTLRRTVRHELTKWGMSPNTMSLFVLANRTRRAIAASPFLLLEKRLRNVAPFLDHDVVECALSVPAVQKLGGELYREVIRLIDPRLSGIPSSNDKVWPDAFPRRKRSRYITDNAAPLHSYIQEIHAAPVALQQLVDPLWLSRVEHAAQSDPAQRAAVLREVQGVAEVAFYMNTYSLA